ncbi:response regulator [Chitinibacter fontanus]|uniref:Virulence sensor protein BvgS n=1 Tax=Chitinibacter fontanus TaxID=1737446 RepID=A0A7D5ZHB0_9NEIS|nr:ATP-binding protein [Chitinibacter fontanus]QLI82368.1 response regulator [Chitinibacter fontanus]
MRQLLNRWRQAERSILISAAIFLLLTFVLIVFFQLRQLSTLRQYAPVGVDNAVWPYTQLSIEYHRLQAQIDRTLLTQGNPAELERLQTRYDMFVSRVEIILHAKTALPLSSQPANQKTVQAITELVKFGDERLNGQTIQDYDAMWLRSLQARLNLLEEGIGQFLLQANLGSAHEADIRSKTVQQQALISTLIAVFQFILLIGLMIMIYRQYALANKRQIELEVLNHTLEQTSLMAQQTSNAKTQFVTNMSHEIRTPMNGVVGMLDLLADTSLNPRQRELTDTARNSARHLLALLNDILDVAKLESGKLTLENQPYDLARLLNEVQQLLLGQAQIKQVGLQLNLPDDFHHWQLGDEVRVRQVMFNLIGNAVKFTECGQVEISLEVQPEHFQIAVKDSGIGMSAQTLSQLFQRFNQGDTSTTRKYGGTGLGLEISRTLMEMMGGDISVESTLGQGSIFTVNLPRHDCEAPVATSAAADHEQLSSLRILAVDDNPINLKVIGALLQKLGQQVSFANNGEEAINAVQQAQFDLILMDGQMPVMDGAEATRRIRQLGGSFTRLPIVALTADVLSEARDHYLAAGMNDYLSKPIDMAALKRLLYLVGRGEPLSHP